MCGPLNDALSQAVGGVQREEISMAIRNALRLVKLVDSLLDYARIEARRVHAQFMPTDVVQLTRQLAGMFRSLIESAGLEFDVDLHPLPQQPFLDRDMWEKIVCNLLSNAYKYTIRGSIHMSLCISGSGSDASFDLIVSDTGCGIAQEHLSKLFQRFYRVPGSRGRSAEGSGIGLALTAELVKMHGGHMQVTSQVERGSTFTVTIPFGSAHLPPDEIIQAAAVQLSTTSVSFIEEAKRWEPELSTVTGGFSVANGIEKLSTVLVVDDNADMRQV
jgi:signal transduction histidine kinase